jgi:hypothetical protein
MLFTTSFSIITALLAPAGGAVLMKRTCRRKHMDTETIDKAKIAARLRKMTEERLFGDKVWPVDNNDEVHRKFVEWGLIEYVNETDFHATALGAELSVDYWSMFMGHHEPSEIPDMLVEYGLLAKEEADHIIFDRWERDGEKLDDILPPILRHVYRA